VRKTRGAQIWTHQRVVDLIERPLDYDYDAMFPAYRERPTGDIQSLKVDRVIGDGEVIHWRGHEAVVAATPVPSRMATATPGNSCTASPQTSFWAATRGQSHDPKPLMDRCVEAAVELREAFVDLTNHRDYRLAYDPYWVRVHPYRVRVTRGGTAEATIVAKNFLDVPTVYEIKVACPKGITIDPSVAVLRVEAGEYRRLPLRVSAATNAAAGLALTRNRRLAGWRSLRSALRLYRE